LAYEKDSRTVPKSPLKSSTRRASKGATLFADLLRQLRYAPDKAVTGMVREARAKYGSE
jgi:hypothetical protein